MKRQERAAAQAAKAHAIEQTSKDPRPEVQALAKRFERLPLRSFLPRALSPAEIELVLNRPIDPTGELHDILTIAETLQRGTEADAAARRLWNARRQRDRVEEDLRQKRQLGQREAAKNRRTHADDHRARAQEILAVNPDQDLSAIAEALAAECKRAKRKCCSVDTIRTHHLCGLK